MRPTAKVLARLWKWLAEPILAIVLTVIATSAIAQPFYVPSGSMEPTLQIGDYLLGSKFAYGYSRYSLPFALGPQSQTRLFGSLPKRGDVVVFRLPRDPSITYVKRVIGLPGDRVQMQNGRLIINGKPAPLEPTGVGNVEESDGFHHPVGKFIETLPGGARHPIFKVQWDGMLDNTEVFNVPHGHIFVMGDNRDNSLDSRVSPKDGGVGFVPLENLMARADLTVGSFDFLDARSLLSGIRAIRFSRFLQPI